MEIVAAKLYSQGLFVALETWEILWDTARITEKTLRLDHFKQHMSKKLWVVNVLNSMLATPDSSAVHKGKSLPEKKKNKENGI